MSIEPLGKRLTIYRGVRGWTVAFFVADNLPTHAAAQLAADAFTTPFAAGWRAAMSDLFQLWVEAKMWTGEMWSVGRITEWLRGACERLAPGVVGV
jgi:hypothetical protein